MERGYTAASFANIALRLNLTKGALTYHFPTKNELGAALIEEGTSALVHADAVTRTIYPQPGLAAVVGFQLVLGHALVSRPHVAAALEVYTDVNAPRAQSRTMLATWDGFLATYLATAQARGEISDEVPVEAASEFMVLTSLGQYHYYSRAQLDEREPRLRNYRIALRGLGCADADGVVDGAIQAVALALGSLPPSGSASRAPHTSRP